MKENKTDSDSSQSTTKVSGISDYDKSIQAVFSTYALPVEEYQTIRTPKYTWKCQLHPGTYLMVEEHRVPNWFHRKMQEICFGIRWMKNDK